jgi:hypothetical protein
MAMQIDQSLTPAIPQRYFEPMFNVRPNWRLSAKADLH